MISWAVPESNGWYLAVGGTATLVLLAWSLALLEMRRTRRLHRFAGPETLERIRLGHAPGLRRPLNLFVVLGTAFLALALAGPEWGEDTASITRGRREVLFLLDTSESMNAANPAPSRLERARSKITELLRRNPADRFGLIAFSGGAALQCPLTTDHGYFKTVLHAVDTDTLSEEGTDIESAFQEASAQFLGDSGRENAAGRDDRIVLLISDGEEVSGDAIAASRSLSASSHVMVLGIGDPEGAEVTLPQWMHQAGQGPEGTRSHWSRLGEENLTEIALAGDGIYVRSTLGDDDIAVINRELAFLKGSESDEDGGRQQVNRYRWPLALALLLFLGEGLWLVALPRLVRRERPATEKEGGYATR